MSEEQQDIAATPEETVPQEGEGDWKAVLPDDLAADSTVQNCKSLPDAIRMLVNAQKLIGAERLAVPQRDDDPNWEAVYDRLGRPETPEAYEFADGEEAQPLDTAFLAEMRGLFHRAGLSQRQAASLTDGYRAYAAEAVAEAERERTAAAEAEEAALRRQWGAAYNARLDQARRAAKRFADETAIDALEGAVGRAAVLRFFARVGAALGEDDLAGQGSGNFAPTPEEARAAIDAFKLDREKFAAYLDRSHPGHGTAVAEMKRLHEALGG